MFINIYVCTYIHIDFYAIVLQTTISKNSFFCVLKKSLSNVSHEILICHNPISESYPVMLFNRVGNSLVMHLGISDHHSGFGDAMTLVTFVHSLSLLNSLKSY